MTKTIKSAVIASDDGTAFWQPGVEGNLITIKVSPWNIADTQHTIFLHELPKNGEVPAHTHEINAEIFICLAGEGIMTIDGEDSSFKKHDIAYIAPHSTHRIRAISDETLKYMVIITPTGLEERLKLMGIAKIGETAPNAFSSAIGKENTHGVVRQN